MCKGALAGGTGGAAVWRARETVLEEPVPAVRARGGDQS